ncbi:MAG: PPOX class F420-dependent oxidoreductase [Chloroflexota bacterium]
MKEMTRKECLAFLLAKPRTAKVATVRGSGRPHVAPVWFTMDGEDLIFTTWHTSLKTKNLDQYPWVSICVDDDQPPFAFVKLDGTAALSNDPNALRRWATLIAGRYMGAAEAEAYGKRNSVKGELLVRIKISSIMGRDDVAGW